MSAKLTDIRIPFEINYNDFLNKLKSDFKTRYGTNQTSSSVGLEKYENLQVLGIGAFGVVFLVKHKITSKCYAMKQSAKAHIVKTKQVKQTIREKRLLMALNFPFIVFLEFSFKDNDCIYYGMQFINGGEMFYHLRRVRKFSEPLVCFYGAQVILALEYFHRLDIIYRDLKPENILFDYRGYLRITDLGFCKIIDGRTYTLCGTPEYIAPEIISTKGYGYAADWWSFGVLLYEMSYGSSAFYVKDRMDHMSLYSRIMDGNYNIPNDFGPDLGDLVTHLLQVDTSKRIGNLKNGMEDIKKHLFFKDINWIALFNKEVNPPYIPRIRNECDAAFFQPEPVPPLMLSKSCQFEKEFEDF